MVIIRSATPDDFPAVLELWSREAAVTRVPSDDAALRRLHAHDPEGLLVADDEGDIIGTLVAGWDGWRCHLYRVAVDRRRQRGGIGRRLLDEAARRMRDRGGARLDAMVHDDNADGRAFWYAVGFEPDLDDHRWTRLLS